MGNDNLSGLVKTVAEALKSKLGNSVPQKHTNLHYRRFYKDELENDKEIFPYKVFDNYDVMRGQTRGLKRQSKLMSYFRMQKTDASGAASDLRAVGYFKGLVEVFNEKEDLKF